MSEEMNFIMSSDQLAPAHDRLGAECLERFQQAGTLPQGTRWRISTTGLADGVVWSSLPDQNSFESFLWGLLKAQVYPVEVRY